MRLANNLHLISFVNLILKHQNRLFAAHSKVDITADTSKKTKFSDNKNLNFKN